MVLCVCVCVFLLNFEAEWINFYYWGMKSDNCRVIFNSISCKQCIDFRLSNSNWKCFFKIVVFHIKPCTEMFCKINSGITKCWTIPLSNAFLCPAIWLHKSKPFVIQNTGVKSGKSPLMAAPPALAVSVGLVPPRAQCFYPHPDIGQPRKTRPQAQSGFRLVCFVPFCQKSAEDIDGPWCAFSGVGVHGLLAAPWSSPALMPSHCREEAPHELFENDLEAPCLGFSRQQHFHPACGCSLLLSPH